MIIQSLEDIHTVVIHCSATPARNYITAAHIDRMHRARGWRKIGYHRVIRLDGAVEQGRLFTERGAHVKGNNVNTLGICMIGGLDEEGQPADTFTRQQYETLRFELFNIKKLCRALERVVGHRDFSPDLNGDGLIQPNEWIKACPCFEVQDKLTAWGFEL